MILKTGLEVRYLPKPGGHHQVCLEKSVSNPTPWKIVSISRAFFIDKNGLTDKRLRSWVELKDSPEMGLVCSDA
jgi:hypothetical protein